MATEKKTLRTVAEAIEAAAYIESLRKFSGILRGLKSDDAKLRQGLSIELKFEVADGERLLQDTVTCPKLSGSCTKVKLHEFLIAEYEAIVKSYEKSLREEFQVDPDTLE